jgi:hypothetical protein
MTRLIDFPSPDNKHPGKKIYLELFMRKKRLVYLLFLSLFVTILEAQIVTHTSPDLNTDGKENLFHIPSIFKPLVNIFIGYGFPNVDQNYLPRYEGMYHGNISQTGPLMAALDYQFNRRVSIGIIVTRGIVSTPYYDDSSPTQRAFTARFYNWSCMLDVVRYIPVDQKVFPYIRTAVGVNSWNQEYTAIDGSKASVRPVSLPRLAYQAGIGAKFIVLGNAGVFVEAGYGKYVFDGGLSVKL